MRTRIAPALPLTLTLALALLAGCAGGAPSGAGSGAGPWQKAGANEQTMAQDSAACRAPTRAEALRRYPYRDGSPSLGAAGAVLSQQQDATDRAIVEESLFNSCMQGRGYSRPQSAK